MAYSVPDLPYDYNALEPHIDEATMRLHHDKHHQAYVDKVNAALEGTDWADKPVEEVLKNLDKLGDKETAVQNNGGGHDNHSPFWEWMSPDGGGEPAATGGRDRRGLRLLRQLPGRDEAGRRHRFGSGWGWLVEDAARSRSLDARTRTPVLRRPDAAAGRGRVGARLLPEVPEQATRLHRRLVERGELGEGRGGYFPSSRLARSRLLAPSEVADQAGRRGRLLDVR